MLAGQGADEPHGGYGRHQAAALLERPAARPRRRPPRPPPRWPGRSPARRAPAGSPTCSAAAATPSACCAWSRSPTRRVRVALLGAGARRAGRRRAPRARARTCSPTCPAATCSSRRSTSTRACSCPDGILICNDKMSMAAGLELRVPFLDLELMRFVERIPASARVRPRAGKRLHRMAMERLLPPEIAGRPKHGFSTPYDDWLRASLGEEVERRYAPGGAARRSSSTRRRWRRLVAEHRARPRRPQEHPLLPARALRVAPRLRRGAGAGARRERSGSSSSTRARRASSRSTARSSPSASRSRTSTSPGRVPNPLRGDRRRGARRPRVRLVRLLAHLPPVHARLAAAQAVGADHRRLRHRQHAGHRLRLPAGRPAPAGEPLDHAPRAAADDQLASTASARSSATRRSRRSG